MSTFFDKKLEKRLQDAKSRINAITTVYNMELAKLSQPELIYADTVIKYSQLMINKGMQAFSDGKGRDDAVESCENYANAEIVKYVKDKYGITIPTENAPIAIDGAKARSASVFETMDNYKKAIHDAYLTFESTLKHCSPVPDLSELRATVRENQYSNEIIKGIFASSDYDDTIHYMGRAVAGGMIYKNGILVYPSNPFSDDQNTKTKLKLKKPIYLYSVNAKDFEPSITLELMHGTREDGSSIFFPDLRFDGEWTCKVPSINCEMEEIDDIPTSILKNCQIFYSTTKSKFDANPKSKEDYKTYVMKLYKKKKLGYVNDEVGVNSLNSR